MRQDLKLAFMGPQGSGKGTQAEMLAKEFNYQLLGMGSMLREVAAKGDEFGNKIDAILDKGDLVPTELTIQVLQKKLEQQEAGQGFVIDGFPRSMDQVEAIEGLVDFDRIVIFEISDQESLDRLLSRYMCQRGHIYNIKTDPPKQPGKCDIDGTELTQRDDDNETAIRNRLAIYRQETRQVIDYYKQMNKLIEINGQQSIDKVYEDLKQELFNL